MQKQQLEHPETRQEPVNMENLPALPVDAKELEAILVKLGAEVSHPVKLDPVARVDGKVVGFWVE